MAYKVTGFNIIDDSRNIINATVVGVGTTVAAGSTKLFVVGDSWTTGIATFNVAQGTAPISVASSTLVNNFNANYLNNRDEAFFRNASNLNSGIVPGDRLSTATNGFSVTGNMSVSGNISIGGSITQTTISQVRIQDRDITLGITTDANGNDISTDITANHGGISIASTVGFPIINIPIDGVNTDPSTYKQFMWVRQGHYGAGFGTDAWISNYAISIGNTSSVQNGSRLTVGAGFTVFDTYLDATDIRARHINATGVVTSSNHNLLTGGSYQINGTSVLNANTLGSGVVNSSLTSVGTLGSLNVSGTTTLGFATVTNFFAGVGTFGTIRPTNITDGSSVNGSSGQFLIATGVGIAWTSIAGLTGGNISTSTRSNTVDIATSNTQSGNILFATAGLGTSVFTDTDITYNSATNTLGAVNINATGVVTSSNHNLLTGGSYQINGTSVLNANTLGSGVVNSSLTSVGTLGSLNVSGTTTLGFVTTGNVFISGVSTHVGFSTFRGGVSVSGATTSTNFAVGNTIVLTTTNSQITLAGIATIDATTRTTLERELAFAPNIIDDIQVTGISTFVNGPVLIGTATSTGTIGQVLQVGSAGATRGAYFSGSVGIGTTLPSQPLDVNGNVRLRASLFDNNNLAGTSGQFLTVTGAGVSWTTISGVTAGSISTAARAQALDVISTNAQTGNILFATSGNAVSVYNDTDLSYSSSTNTLTINNTVVGAAVTINNTGISVVGIVTASDFNSSSDRILKDNIQVIQNPIEKVLQMSGVSFAWKKNGQASMGVIAQEVEQVLPELVSDTNPKSVNYNGLIGLLIECVKEQQKQIDELKKATAKKPRKPKTV